jgi:hypothetical protein
MKLTGLSVARLAALVSTELRKWGIEVVLSGGSCVTIYSANRYVSKGLDFVLSSTTPQRQITEALAAVGFRPDGSFYTHPELSIYVDLLPPPLAVGSEPPGQVTTRRFGRWTLRLLSPTDCVKDRLAAYFFWDDRQAFEQALLVALAQEVDLRELRRWSRNEGESAKLGSFTAELLHRRRPPVRRAPRPRGRAPRR